MKKLIIILILAVLFIGCMSTSSSLIHSNEKVISNRTIKIEELLNNDNVNLIIIMPKNEVTNNYMYSSEYDEWVNRQTQIVTSSIMSGLIKYFASNEKFKIVDRQIIDSIINEQVFSLSDLVRNDTRIRIGNITGANYILYCTFDLYRHMISNTKYTFTNSMIAKLISIETGEVVSIDIYKDTITTTYIFGQWNNSTIRYYINNRENVYDERDEKWYYK